MSVTAVAPAISAAARPADTGLSLAVQGVDLRFGGIHALRNVSFSAAPGQITAVIGPNGAGKTSVFNTISGFYRPSAGRIVLGNEDITNVPVNARAARGLARTFQNIALFRGLTVLENIKLGGHHTMKANVFSALGYLGGARDEEIALREEVERKVISFLEIDHIRHQSVDALPYGLQKRVELARALAMRPRVLLLDEPVAGMNREETEDMARYIRRAGGGEVTVLMDEHSLGIAWLGISIAGRAILNFERWSVANGTPTEVRRGGRQVIEAYLGGGSRGHGMSEFLEYSLLGLLSGGVMALIALSFVLIYKGTGVVNFAVGEVMMLGAYVYYAGAVSFGLVPWLAFVIALAVISVLAIGVGERTCRPLSRPTGGGGSDGDDRHRQHHPRAASRR